MKCGPDCQHTINLEHRADRHEKALHRIAKEVGEAVDETGQMYDVLMQDINHDRYAKEYLEPELEYSPTAETTVYTEKEYEELAEHAYCEYWDALGVAEGDYTPWKDLLTFNRRTWRAVVKAILDEVKRS
jgi:hypothetical protein